MITRRQFLLQSAGCASYFAASHIMSSLNSGIAWAASSCVPSNKVLVHLFLEGGLDSPSLLVPLNSQPYIDLRPTIRITNPLAVDSRYGLHPSLVRIQGLMTSGRCAIINKVGYPKLPDSQSHEVGQAVYSRAMRLPGSNTTGWAGRFGDAYCGGNTNVASVFNFKGGAKDVSANNFVATSAGALGGYSYSSDSVSLGQNDSRYRRMVISANRAIDPIGNDQQLLVNNSWKRVEQAVPIIQQVAALATNPDPALAYGNDGLSNRFRDAARLIASNENPSIILLSQGGYDTHGDSDPTRQQNAQLSNILGALDRAIGAFWADLTRLGRENDVTLQVFTEFGRETKENNSAGTDHGFGTVALVFGSSGTINSGVFGPDYVDSDFTNKNRWLPAEVDFREVMWQGFARHMGVDPAPIFPETFAQAGLAIYK